VQPADVERLRRFAEAQREEAHRLQEELSRLNARLGEARARQERLQRPSTLLTERVPERWRELRDRARSRWHRR
jgi:predicted nuclease with TOPRIM domain